MQTRVTSIMTGSFASSSESDAGSTAASGRASAAVRGRLASRARSRRLIAATAAITSSGFPSLPATISLSAWRDRQQSFVGDTIATTRVHRVSDCSRRSRNLQLAGSATAVDGLSV